MYYTCEDEIFSSCPIDPLDDAYPPKDVFHNHSELTTARGSPKHILRHALHREVFKSASSGITMLSRPNLSGNDPSGGSCDDWVCKQTTTRHLRKPSASRSRQITNIIVPVRMPPPIPNSPENDEPHPLRRTRSSITEAHNHDETTEKENLSSEVVHFAGSQQRKSWHPGSKVTVPSMIEAPPSDSITQRKQINRAENMFQPTEQILSLVLDRGFSASLDEFPNPLAVWQTMNKCLKDISILADAEPVVTCSLSRQSYEAVRSYAPQGSSGSGAKRPLERTEQRAGGQDQENEDDGEENSGDENEGDDGSSDKRARRLKRPSTRTKKRPNVLLSCPFRKRNPARFNIRNYDGICANTPFSSISNLKIHITAIHRRPGASPFTCERCYKGFETQDDRRAHIRSTPPCPLIPDPPATDVVDPEDGISDEARSRLRDRTKDGKVNEWPELWRVLFGDEEPKSQEFVRPNPLEISELRQALVEDMPSLVDGICKEATEQKLVETAFSTHGRSIWTMNTAVAKGVMRIGMEHIQKRLNAYDDNIARGDPLRPPGMPQEDGLDSLSVSTLPDQVAPGQTQFRQAEPSAFLMMNPSVQPQGYHDNFIPPSSPRRRWQPQPAPGVSAERAFQQLPGAPGAPGQLVFRPDSPPTIPSDIGTEKRDSERDSGISIPHESISSGSDWPFVA